ncbi:hypothetical protein BBB39_10555 [Bordetella trematum]|uniref:Activator of Hsp90 ATPase homolog 1-like protein n=2 Tax=Bordetella trematum TaxID=123899 RepID=A0A157SQI1_9BORD|nr:hypothetical protein [Bordetella trematum]AUL47301.1 hypothetical protein BTL55_10195 [Bordetella trematum]AZR94165.1 hypothetical protein BBB39_10555 [Bordetella trematum]NNH20477.1 polyketide cyclase [Bordetella trematum]QIM72705.1 polyketide cyclase [Bordetella trematum]SAH76638.1 Uncharacterised protein [Bordetella trematum]
MTDPVDTADEALVLEFELQAEPQKVWRAIHQDALREQWVPALADVSPLSSREGEEVVYPWRDRGQPEGQVTFRVRAAGEGCSILTIVHVRGCANEPLMRLAA